MKKIGMILEKTFPPDIRVEKEIRLLVKKGFKVFLLCQLRKKTKEKEAIREEFVIQRVDESNIFLRKIRTFKFFISFQDNLWKRELVKFVNNNKIDILHVHDLPLLGIAINIAKKNNIKIISDLHENWPEMLQLNSSRNKFENLMLKPFKNLNRWRKYEKNCLKLVDEIIVVVDEAKKRIIQQYNIPKSKITVISNVVDISNIIQMGLDKMIIEKYKDKYIILYVGGFGDHRGLTIAIKALYYLKNTINNIVLLFVGKGNRSYENKLKYLVKKYNLKDKVEFAGYQPFNKVPSYIEASNICLIPHRKNPHTDSTIPHKLFQYMFMNKPVIVSNCRPLKRIVDEAKCGLVFKTDNSEDLAIKIKTLFYNKKLSKIFGENGKKIVIRKYNWELEGEKLLSMYKTL